MMDGTNRVEFDDVEVIESGGLLVQCRVAGRVVGVPPLRMLPGTTVHRAGDRGRLVLPREVAMKLLLV